MLVFAFHSRNDKFQLCFGFFLVSFRFESTSRSTSNANKSIFSRLSDYGREVPNAQTNLVKSQPKKVSLFNLWQIFVGELSLLLNLAIIKIFLLFFFWWASSLKNTLATRMHHLAEGAFPRFAMKQKPHSRNKFKSSTWIMDFLLPSLFVSLWNFYAPQKTSHKLIFFAFYDGIRLFIQLFTATFEILARLSPALRQQVDPINPSKSVGEWISWEFQSKFPQRPAELCA